MDFTEAVRKRRMVRHFTAEPVAPEVIERIVTLARQAPSAGFTQGQSFIVVTGRTCGRNSRASAAKKAT